MQRLGDNRTNHPTVEQAVDAHESNTSQGKQEPQTVEQEDKTFPPTRNIGVGHGAVPPWQPGMGCMLDERSPRKYKEVSDERAERIIKNIEDEQAQGIRHGMRLEKTLEHLDKKNAGWDMFSDQDQDLRVSFALVMYQPTY